MHNLVCDPGMELVGQAALSFIDNVQADEILPYLGKYGLDHIEYDHWYPASKLMDLMNELASSSDVSTNMVAIGMKIAEKMVMPPEMEHAPLPVILSAWDVLYHMQHRNLPNPHIDIGYVKCEKIDDAHYKTVHKHLYPDDMTYGLAYGMAWRFLPKGTHFSVYYDEHIPHRDDGGDETIIHLRWN